MILTSNVLYHSIQSAALDSRRSALRLLPFGITSGSSRFGYFRSEEAREVGSGTMIRIHLVMTVDVIMTASMESVAMAYQRMFAKDPKRRHSAQRRNSKTFRKKD